jgi:LysR family transcriptional regulator, hydrogen peroxide-inducible genes activator
MVAAGMGVCFLPQYSNTIPGVITRPVISPSIEREVCLVTVAGRRWSSPVSALVRAVKQYRWPGATGVGNPQTAALESAAAG